MQRTVSSPTTRALSLRAYLPRQPLDTQQHEEAIRRAEAEAQRRIELGRALFRAAEDRLTAQRRMIESAQARQEKLRKELAEHTRQRLDACHERISGLDERMMRAVERLEERVDVLEARWDQAYDRLEQMVQQSSALLAQSRELLGEAEALKTEPAPVGEAATPSEPAEEVFWLALQRGVENRPPHDLGPAGDAT